MRKRTKTLFQNAAVYIGLVGVLLVDGWFGVSHVGKQKKAASGLRKEIKSLESEWERKDRELKDADQKADDYVKAIASRREELRSYGQFLPPDSDRPDVQKFILQTIEDLHIEIKKTEEVKLSKKAHYSTLDVALTLRGSYKDFKLLLARIYKSESFIRIKKFDVLLYEDDQHMQEVDVQFQTYFSNNRS